MGYSRFMAVGALLTAAACGGDSAAPHAGPPAKVVMTTAPASSLQVGAAATPLVVRVTDASGVAVGDAAVTFTAIGAGTASPATIRTDASGDARTMVAVDTIVGSVTIVASVTGSSATARTTVVVTAGPLAQLILTPPTAHLFYAGDSVRLSTAARDRFGNGVPVGDGLTFTVGDPTLLRVSVAGLVTVLRQDGSSPVIATAATHADTATITVEPAGVTPCTGVSAPVVLAAGELITLSGVANGCLSGTPTGAEFALIAFNGTLDGNTSLSATVTGHGSLTPPAAGFSVTPSLAARASLAALRATVRGGPAASRRIDESFHVRLRERADATVQGRAAAARSWYDARLRARPSTRLGRFGVVPSSSAIPALPQVGDLLRVNVNSTEDCHSPAYRQARIVAIGTRSIVLADTLNPADGFTAADYARFASRFDTLVYPLDVGAFGEPTDIDGNGRVAILFTRSVNELTPPGSNAFVAGFFFSRDLLPTAGAAACDGSNEGELFYMLVPDPGGSVNGNEFRLGFVDSLTTAVIAHEFQHLINASRRLFVNHAVASEAVWLNEGLSHVAEELLYYRESGMTPRRNLGDAAVRLQAPAAYPYFKADVASNMSRLVQYLANPGANSPIANNDGLATRGATWSFLRYAVDQLYPSDGDSWARFDNSTTSGLETLRTVFGASADLPLLFRNWAIANLVDDAAGTTDVRFLHPSWNFRDLFGTTFGSYDAGGTVFVPLGYPLAAAPLTDGVPVGVRARGASANYYRLAVQSGRETLLTFSSGSAVPDAALQFVIVRTR